MRVFYLTLFFFICIIGNTITQVTLLASDGGSKTLNTTSAGNFALLRGTSTISSWTGSQTGATYFTSPTTSGIGSVASGGSSGNSFQLAITNNTGATISSITLNCTILHHKDNNTANLTETLTASGVTGANNWNLSVTSDGNTTNNVYNPPLEAAFSGTITGLTFTNGTTITITWADANDAGTDAMFGLGAASLNWVPLPIQIKHFAATKQSSATRLNLITASETNNDYFTIERSGDGRNFESIGEIKGAGNSNQELNYEFVDESPLADINFYRIKQTDFDGAYSYSDIRSVRHKGDTNINISPRNTDGKLTITTDLNQYNVLVYNISGQEVQRFYSLNGDQTVSLESLQAGVYVVKVISGSESETMKVVKH